MISAPARSAVLLIAFNRPDCTAQVLAAIRRAGSRRLYVALDGPRSDRAGEEALCAEVAALFEPLTWTEQVRVRRRPDNLGCKAAVTDALDWFFAHEPEGIVLEDDCLAADGFFAFCDEMLARYREDHRVWMVSGDNLLGAWRPRRSDYFFGDGGIWGWASWRRAWQQRDIEMQTWSDERARASARSFLGQMGWSHLSPSYAAVARDEIDTWDYQWSWSRAAHGGLCVIPARNLVSNIGFGPQATHTVDVGPLAAMSTGVLSSPLRGPASMRVDRVYQNLVIGRERFLPKVMRLLGALPRRRAAQAA